MAMDGDLVVTGLQVTLDQCHHQLPMWVLLVATPDKPFADYRTPPDKRGGNYSLDSPPWQIYIEFICLPSTLR